MTIFIPSPQLSIAAQMAFYLDAAEDSIQFFENGFDEDSCTIEIDGSWFDVYFDSTGLVVEYLPA